VAEEEREAHRRGEEEVDPRVVVSRMARVIAEADGQRAGLFWPGDGVVAGACGWSEND
jgi:hypothetical protein